MKSNDAGTPASDRFSPTLADLIATVRDFLKDAGREHKLGYDGQVARYLLDMSVRELELGAVLDQHAAQRIASLMGEAADVASLCRSIRAGAFDERWEELLRVMLEDTVERVAIIRPDVLSPEHGHAR
ncbi:MAG: DUF6285 domain-containing protein [Panacagrimonas sp.]